MWVVLVLTAYIAIAFTCGYGIATLHESRRHLEAASRAMKRTHRALAPSDEGTRELADAERALARCGKGAHPR